MAGWGHQIRPLRADAYHWTTDRATGKTHCGHTKPKTKTQPIRHCGRDAVVVCSFMVCTSQRSGRTTLRELPRCEEHAREFADRHGVDMPGVDTSVGAEQAGKAGAP